MDTNSQPDNQTGTNTIDVVFGTGPIGQAVISELLAKNKRVRAVNRSGKGGGNFPDCVQYVGGDATDHEFTRRACEGASVVYNCLNAPYTEWPHIFPLLQAGVLEGAAFAGAKLIVMENVYMYGPTNGRPLTEDLPYAATTRKGKVRAQMSRDLMEAHSTGKVRVAIGRASDYYGPGALTTAMGDRIFYPALAGKAAQVLGNPDLLHTYTYVPDIGRGLVLLGEHNEALGQAWHLPSAQTVTTRDFISMIFEEAGQEPRIQTAPKIVLQVMGLFDPSLREMIEMLYEFEEPFVVDHTRFERAFGNCEHACPTPIREAIHETVTWYKLSRATDHSK